MSEQAPPIRVTPAIPHVGEPVALDPIAKPQDVLASNERTPWKADLNEREGARLLEYAASKEMSTSAVLRQALRVYDLMEQTPGAYEAVRTLGPQFPLVAPDETAAEPMPFKDWAADMRTQSMRNTMHAYKAKIQKLEYELACRPAPETPAPQADMAHLDAVQLRRIIDRHIRWRTEALRLLTQVNTGYEGEWPEIAEFVRNSTVVPVIQSPVKST